MSAKDIIKQSLQMSAFVMSSYLEDLSEDELFIRSAENANHTAWQLGHLITSENSFMSSIMPDKTTALPDGFAEKHTKEMSHKDTKDAFCTKDEYMELLARVRAETLNCLEEIEESRFLEDAPEAIRSYSPTIGDTFALCASHLLMHSGQVAVLRRKLNKPIVI